MIARDIPVIWTNVAIANMWYTQPCLQGKLLYIETCLSLSRAYPLDINIAIDNPLILEELLGTALPLLSKHKGRWRSLIIETQRTKSLILGPQMITVFKETLSGEMPWLIELRLNGLIEHVRSHPSVEWEDALSFVDGANIVSLGMPLHPERLTQLGSTFPQLRNLHISKGYTRDSISTILPALASISTLSCLKLDRLLFVSRAPQLPVTLVGLEELHCAQIRGNNLGTIFDFLHSPLLHTLVLLSVPRGDYYGRVWMSLENHHASFSSLNRLVLGDIDPSYIHRWDEPQQPRWTWVHHLVLNSTVSHNFLDLILSRDALDGEREWIFPNLRSLTVSDGFSGYRLKYEAVVIGKIRDAVELRSSRTERKPTSIANIESLRLGGVPLTVEDKEWFAQNVPSFTMERAMFISGAGAQSSQ